MLFKFLKDEGLVGWNFFNLFLWWNLFWRLKITQFVLVGGTGVLIQLVVTWGFTNFVFGLDKYYIGYSIGLSLNLIYNFVMHTFVTFSAKRGHGKRFIGFIIYSLLMTLLQYLIVRGLVYLVGEKWYLLVIATVVLVFSIVTFLLFKFWLFKE
jgi:putative flippase GtrA